MPEIAGVCGWSLRLGKYPFTDVPTDVWTYAQMYKCIDGHMDILTDEQADIWTNRCMDKQTYQPSIYLPNKPKGSMTTSNMNAGSFLYFKLTSYT